METVSRFIEDPGGSFFLFGPRGTGKTTWLRAKFPDALWIDLNDPEVHRTYQARPERLLDRVRAEPDGCVVVVDEVQRVPELLSAVHLLIEERQRTRFVLTGSSARKLRRTGVNLLAGRAILRSLHPFLASELGHGFVLKDALRLGMVPLVLAAQYPEETLRSYLGLYIREEVQAEGLVRNLGAFQRFLEAVCLSHGAVLNISNVARECHVKRKVVEGYLGVLEDLLLAFRVPVFSRRTKRKVVQHPKLYLFDAGVFHALRRQGPLDRSEEVEGPALEGLVAQALRAWSAYRRDPAELYYWRTRGGSEVDFVVYGPDTFCAIEVKNSRDVRSDDLRALKAFREDYPEASVLLLYRGQDPLLRDGIRCLPVETFLRALRPDQGLMGAG